MEEIKTTSNETICEIKCKYIRLKNVKESKLKHLASYKVTILRSSGLSLSFMRYFYAKTHTETRISSFFFLSLSHSFTCPTLCGIYFLFLSLTTLLFTLRLSRPASRFTPAVPTLVCLQFYSFVTHTLSVCWHYFATPVLTLQCDFHSDYFISN